MSTHETEKRTLIGQSRSNKVAELENKHKTGVGNSFYGEMTQLSVLLENENVMLREVYEAARRVLRFNGVDRIRTTIAVDVLDAAIERVKLFDGRDGGMEDTPNEFLFRFAGAIAELEREACAMVAEGFSGAHRARVFNDELNRVASSIRARSNF